MLAKLLARNYPGSTRMKNLPVCRHRGEELSPDRWRCNSPRLIVSPDGVPGDICRFKCPYVDHTADSPPRTSRRRLAQVLRFARALVRHLVHGLPTASPTDQAARWAICQPCPQRSPDNTCGKCGCQLKGALLNKLAFARERCPIDKWGPVKGEKLWARAWRWVRALVRRSA